MPRPSRLRQIVFGSLRVATLLVVCAIALLYIDYRVARAAVFERLLGLGQRMAPYLDDDRTTERPREVRLNGARFWVAAGKTAHPPAMVRKFYRDRYVGKDGGLTDLANEMSKRKSLPAGVPEMRVFEFGEGDTGGVASLDFGDSKQDLRTLASRLKKMVTTGDLGDLASLRYCYTERKPDGGTRFLTVWTDASFSLRQLVPPADAVDAPGFDVADVPRYPGHVRILSAEESGMPQRMSVYEGPAGSPEAAKVFYRARMNTLGWQEEPTFAKLAEDQGKSGLHFVRDGREVFLTFTDRAAGQGLSVVVIQTH